ADTALELGLCRLHRVVVGDLEPACDDVAQQAVGLTARLWMGATAEEVERLRARLQRRFELAAQAALADPALADHRDDDEAPLRKCTRKLIAQLRELGIAPDQRRPDALDAARLGIEGARLRTQHE